MVGIKYRSDIVMCAFGFDATSRTLYNRLRDDFQLPSLATLGRMTLKVSKLNEKSFLLSVFNTLNTSQKREHNSPWWSIYQKNVAISWQTTIW